MRLVLFILTIITLACCDNNRYTLDFEKSVAKEVFPLLLDSLHFDKRLTPPPPPKNSDLNDSTSIFWNKTQILEDFERRKKELENDSVRLIVAIIDSTYQIDEKSKKDFLLFYKKEFIKLDSINIDKSYKINIEELKHNPKIKLKYLSNIGNPSQIWGKDYDFHLSGILGISRIQFDSTKKYGVLKSGYSCGKLCGTTIRVFIRKLDEKWIIDDLKVITIS